MKLKQCFPVVLLATLLCGCSCQHEWSEADCVNPQVCTKCEETVGEVLGHDWVAATCTAPETCSRCGETQGEPLTHVFGEWEFTETEMMHSCSICEFEETQELDRGIQLETMIPGLWEFYGLYQGETFYPAYSLPVPGDQLTFGSDRSVAGMVDQVSFSGTWEFTEYQEREDDRLYYFSVTGEDSRNLNMLYVDTPEDDVLHCFFANNTQTLLSRNDTTAAKVLGTWGAEGRSSMYSLTFHEDRTVTGNLEEAFEGTWQLLPIQKIDNEFLSNYQYCGMYIRYLQDGEECVLSATISPPQTYSSDADSKEFIADTISLTYINTKVTFEAMTQDEIDRRTKDMQEGPNLLIGTWSSMYHRRFNTNPSTDTLAMDYSVTFFSDGTFTASVGKEISGTWVYDDKSWGNETHRRYSYYFYIDGDRYPYDMELRDTKSSVPELWMESKSTVVGSRRLLFLNKRSSHQDKMVRTLIGTWTSVFMDYNLTFHEDGTFTGYDGTAVKGTWVYERTRDETVHQYNLFLNGKSQEYASITMYDHSNSGDDATIDYMISTESGYRTISLEHLTAEDLDETTPENLNVAAYATELLAGKWYAYSVNHDSSETIYVNKYKFPITFREDGTFSGTLNTKLDGTWSFDRNERTSDYYYHFTFPGQDESQPYYIYIDEYLAFMRLEIVTGDTKDTYWLERE